MKIEQDNSSNSKNLSWLLIKREKKNKQKALNDEVSQSLNLKNTEKITEAFLWKFGQYFVEFSLQDRDILSLSYYLVNI